MYERHYGSKYDRNLTTTQIAKLLREGIKDAIKKGRLPKGKYSVRTEYFSMGSSIDVTIKDIEIPFLNPERVLHGEGRHDEPRRSIYSVEGAQVLDTLKSLAWQWNHDGSDTMTDYFDVNFYFNAKFDWEMEQRERLALDLTLGNAKPIFGECPEHGAKKATPLDRILGKE